jgi:hypothetical protein
MISGSIGTSYVSGRYLDTLVQLGGLTMMKGGLLWLIGIPLPIILILYFLGVLS